MEVLSERLRANGFVCLMADRDLPGPVPVQFFGEPTCLPAGPAMKLAIETVAPLHPAHVYYDGPDCVVQIDEAIDTSSGDVGLITQALADRFAVNIAAHPQDWHMLQPLWLADLSEGALAPGWPKPPGRPGLMRIGMVCPYSFDVHGGSSGARAPTRRGDARTRSLRQRAGTVLPACRTARLNCLVSALRSTC